MGKTLVLIDGHALAYRQFFALERTAMKNSQNQPTWAVYGFFKAVFDLLSKIHPDSIAVTFDVSHRTFRTEMYEDYIEGKKELRDINMEFNARYVKGDMDRDERRSCPM